jgi:hypothetical protein
MTTAKRVSRILGAVTAAMLLFASRASGATDGGSLYTTNCATCHGVVAHGGIGPDITCRTGIVTPVRSGKVGMTPFPSSVLSDADVSSIQDFLRDGCGPYDCGSIDECRVGLDGAMPALSGARNAASKRVTKALTRLRLKAERLLGKGVLLSGLPKIRTFTKARAALTKLSAMATAADAKGTLGVPLEPITATVARLLLMATTTG